MDVRGRGAPRPGSRPKDFFLSIDVAQLCLRQQLPSPRENFLIEYYSDTVFPRIRNMGYRAVRTHRWKYIHYVDLADGDELYDLIDDPSGCCAGPQVAAPGGFYSQSYVFV